MGVVAGCHTTDPHPAQAGLGHSPGLISKPGGRGVGGVNILCSTNHPGEEREWDKRAAGVVEESGCLLTSRLCWDRRGPLGLGRGARVGNLRAFRNSLQAHRCGEPTFAPVTMGLSSSQGVALLYKRWHPGSSSFLLLRCFRLGPYP